MAIDGLAGLARKLCLTCLREPCLCVNYPGMQIEDDALISFATTCNDRGVRLRAEVILRKRYPSRKAAAFLAATEGK